MLVLEFALDVLCCYKKESKQFLVSLDLGALLFVYCNNNNNNYKTYIAPISSKRIEPRGAPSTGIGQTRIPGTMQSSSTNDRMERKLRRGGGVKRGVLTWRRKETNIFLLS